MTRLKIAVGSLIGALIWLAVARPALAVAPVIKDDGKFFSADAIKKADDQIREIARKYDTDLLVETFESVPADQLEKIKAMSGKERNDFFRHWAQERMKEAVVKGVYILVCRNPTYLYVDVTPSARLALGDEAIGKLRQLLLEDFRAQKYDEGLEAAIQFVQQRLAAAK